MGEPPRSRRAREAAERALARLLNEYGEVPDFVLLGGLVPDLLCSKAALRHIGTTDVDLQVNVEIANAGANASRLEAALRASGFSEDSESAWRWRDEGDRTAVVTIEFLADLEDAPNEATIRFDDCSALGALNLRGTGFAERDFTQRELSSRVDGGLVSVRVRVAGLAGYLLAKIHAYYGRRLFKDLYDIAFVLLHNDEGGPRAAAGAVLNRFSAELGGATATALAELAANFRSADSQGPHAYAEVMSIQHPELEEDEHTNDAVLAVAQFIEVVKPPRG